MASFCVSRKAGAAAFVAIMTLLLLVAPLVPTTKLPSIIGGGGVNPVVSGEQNGSPPGGEENTKEKSFSPLEMEVATTTTNSDGGRVVDPNGPNSPPKFPVGISFDSNYFSPDETVPQTQIADVSESSFNHHASSSSSSGGSGVRAAIDRLLESAMSQGAIQAALNSPTPEDSALRATYRDLLKRTYEMTIWRVRRLLKKQTNDDLKSSQIRCAVLKVWSASHELDNVPQRSHPACSDSWKAEMKEACPDAGVQAIIEPIAQCMDERFLQMQQDDRRSTSSSSRSSNYPHCELHLADDLKRAYGFSRTADVIHKRIRQARVTIRNVLRPPNVSAFTATQPNNNNNHNNDTKLTPFAELLQRNDWKMSKVFASSTTKRDEETATSGSSSSWPVRNVRPPFTLDDVVNGRDGICHNPTSKFQLFPQTTDVSRVGATVDVIDESYLEVRRWRTLRVLLRMDLEDVLEIMTLAEEPSRSTPPQSPASSESSDCTRILPVIGSNHLITAMRKSRWLFDTFSPPFLNESQAFHSAPSRITLDVPHPPPPREAKMNQSEWNDAVSASFQSFQNRRVLNGPNSYRLSQLTGPLFHELLNVCVSPDGFGISAYVAPTYPAPRLSTDYRDERRNRIRTFQIRQRNTIPKHFVEAPLMINGVLYQSDNFGHVMYRMGAQQHLLRHTWAPSNLHRIPPFGDPDDMIMAYVVQPSAVGTYGKRSAMRHFYQVFNQSWLAISNARLSVATPTAADEDRELCFRRAWMGHDSLHMYHSMGSSLAMRKRYLQSAQVSQTHVNRYIGFLQDRFRKCMLTPLSLWLTEGAGPRARSASDVSTSVVATPMPTWIGTDDDDRPTLQNNFSTSGVVLLREWMWPYTSTLLAKTAVVRDSSTNAAVADKEPMIRILFIQRRLRRLANLNQLMAALIAEYGTFDATTPSSSSTSSSPHPSKQQQQQPHVLTLRDKRYSNRRMMITVMDMQDWSTTEQAAFAANADILVGVHGTAMQWMFMMRRGSVVVELQYPRLGCVYPGLHSEYSQVEPRLFCEFGKTSIGAKLSHLAFRTHVIEGATFTQFNILLTQGEFLGSMDSALCALHAGPSKTPYHCRAPERG